MSRAISIAGARPLGWLAACASAQRSCLARRAQCNCVARVLQGWVWECAMIVRVCARGRPTSLQTVQTTPFSRLTKNKNHSNPMLGDREIKIAEFEIKNSGLRSSLLMT